MNANDAYLNDFATRSFRDIADQDYIMARAAYRATLYPQFLWSGLQAIEKYLKAILLYNRIPQPKGKDLLRHDLARALELTKQARFQMSLSAPSMEIIAHLDTYGRFRYLESSYHLDDQELLMLDRAVWEVRLYCRVLDHTITTDAGEVIDMLPKYLKTIERELHEPARRFLIPGGVLEKVLAKKAHPARPSLVWKNLFFNQHHRKSLQWRGRRHLVNSPLALRPELLDEANKYVWLPSEAIKVYREEIENCRPKR